LSDAVCLGEYKEEKDKGQLELHGFDLIIFSSRLLGFNLA
jgi:hypothetical protein